MSELRRWHFRDPDDDPYRSDKERLVRIMKERGYECSLDQAQQLWEAYSASMCAGWMNMSGEDDVNVFLNVSSYIEGEG